jgi:hypothetical protein
MDALADQIRSVVDDVTDVEVQVEPRWVVNPTPPCIDIYPGDPSTDQELRAFTHVQGEPLITVRCRVGLTDNVAQQDLLLAFMDDEDALSITQAVAEDDTLGGVATSTDLRSMTGFVRVLEGGDYLGCLWQFVVTKARS